MRSFILILGILLLGITFSCTKTTSGDNTEKNIKQDTVKITETQKLFNDILTLERKKSNALREFLVTNSFAQRNKLVESIRNDSTIVDTTTTYTKILNNNLGGLFVGEYLMTDFSGNPVDSFEVVLSSKGPIIKKENLTEEIALNVQSDISITVGNLYYSVIGIDTTGTPRTLAGLNGLLIKK